MENINVYAEVQLVKSKVPLKCLGMEGVSARRERRRETYKRYFDFDQLDFYVHLDI